MTANIFISHIGDEAAIAEAVKDAISTDFLGMTEVFVSSDLQSIQAGASWLHEVESGLGRANVLLVLCSPRSVSRPWINFEAGAAWLKQIPIVPICHGGLSLMQLPMPLAVMQGVSLSDPRGLKRLYIRIAKTLGAKVLPSRDFELLASRLSALQPTPLPSKSEPAQALDPTAFLDDAALQRAIDHAQLGWTLCFIGEDQGDKLAQLTEDLEETESEDGHGKCFASGFAYWGIGPTLAWARACTDPAYLVAKRGIEEFPMRWKECASAVAGFKNYVSLGIGTGHKDRVILRTMLDQEPKSYFFPVDMSGEMLRVGIAECRKNDDLKRSQILPIQIDFSSRENAAAIWGVVSSVAGDSPALYSLLGNTMANFENDADLLRIVSSTLRSGDKLLIEVATTAEATPQKASRACTEYRRSESFFAFATSALDYYTSLRIDRTCVEFLPSCVDDSSVEVRTVYRNQSASELPLKITTGRQVSLHPNETIRLYLTRKYLESRILSMVESANLVVDRVSRSTLNADGFGSIVVLVSPKP